MIVNSGEKVTIAGGAGNDTLTGSDYGDLFLFSSAHGNNLITNFGANDSLRMTSGKSLTYSTVDSDVIVTLKGAKYTGTVTLAGAAELELKKSGSVLYVDSITEIINEQNDVKISGTGRRDFILNNGAGVTIQSNGGNDTLEGSDYGEMYLFSSADGDNTITNFGVNDTIRMTSGKTMTFATVGSDVVVTLTGTKYTGTVTLQNAASLRGSWKKSGSYLTMSTFNPINNNTSKKKVNGTSGAYYIVNGGENVTIDGKAGNDTIEGSDFGEMICFGADGGEDFITSFGKNDTLQITSGSIQSSIVNGDDVIINIKNGNYTGAITLGGAAKFEIKKSGSYVYADMVNYIVNSADGVKVTGSDGRDFITNSGQRATLQSGADNDTLEGSEYGELYLFSSADGDNVITNFGENDSISMTSGKTMTYKYSSDDVVITLQGTSYTGTIRLLDAANYKFKQEGKVLTVNATNPITRSADKIKITGTNGNDSITSSGEGVTIQSNGGSDTITGSDAFGDLYLFGSADGSNTITNFGAGDSLQCTSGSISATAVSGSDVLVTLKGSSSTATVRLIDATSQKLKKSGKVIYVDSFNPIKNSSDDEYVTGTDGKDYITNTGERVTIASGGGNDTIDGSDFAELYLFSSTDGDNLIKNFGARDSLRMTSGKTLKYSMLGNDVIVTLTGTAYTSRVTLEGAAGLNLEQSGNVLTAKADADVFTNTKDNVRFSGTDGDDYMINTGGDVTINGGNGNDTIEGATDGRELFQFSAPNGDDVIYNFGYDDTLRIMIGEITDAYADGSDYIIEVKSGTLYTGSVRLKNVEAIDIDGKKITAIQLSEQLPSDDYWFISEAADDPLDELLDEAPLDNALALSETPLEYLKAQAMTLTQLEGKKQWQKSAIPK